jgi:outer membrane protein OmpA-like peptidoglycan-associated protein
MEAATSPAAGQSMPAAPASNAVYFSLGSAELSADARRSLDTALADAESRNPKRVEVIGYTDTLGSPDSNEQLSMRRAQAVADELVSRGIPRDIIEVRGRGESDLAVPTGDGVSEARNRRTIIDIEA